MKVLVACEESQRVCIAFRKRGHEAYSCDILPCSGGHPEWHIQDNVLKHLDRGWDLIIAHPPCTHLAVSGARYFKIKRDDGRQRKAIEFFAKMLQAPCPKLAVENPVGIISGNYIKQWFPDLAEKYGFPQKYSQAIQPYEYGHPVSKKTCLWLKGLPLLAPTNVVEPEKKHSKGKSGGYSGASWYATDKNEKILSWNNPQTAIIRSKTFEGIAEAMAEQWGGKER